LSLTSHLGSSKSPVSGWFQAHLADTAWLVREENRRIRGGTGPWPWPCALPPPGGGDVALVGTATDQIVGAWLDVDRLREGPMMQGAVLVDGVSAKYQSVAASEVAAVTLERLQPLLGQDGPSDADWDEVCRLAIVLARFEQAYRNPWRQLLRVVSYLKQSADPFELGALMADPATRADLESVARQTLAMWEDLQEAEQLTLGPALICSEWLGGADADVLVGSRLMDLKTTAQRRPLSRASLWQLLGYALADSDDQHGIREVGFLWPRWRKQSVWELEHLLAITGGHEASLAALRGSFRRMCQKLPAA